MKSIKARKQRKALFNAPLHKRQKNISSHLEENLLLKYDRRRVPLITGDTVKVMRGIYKGHEDKVTKVHVKDYRVEVEGITLIKADGKKIAKPIHPSNLLITKLNLTDKWRRRNLETRVTEEVKKEIESEAKEQIIQLEKEKKAEEERRAAEEAEKTEEESEEPIEEEPVKKTETPKEKKSSEKEKKEPSSEKAKKPDTPKEKKSSEKEKKLEPAKKTPAAKPKAKPKEKKEDKAK